MRRRNFPALILACSFGLLAAPRYTLGQTLSSPGAGTWYDPRLNGGQAAVSVPLWRSLHWMPAGSGVATAELEVAIGKAPFGVHAILVRVRTDSLRADLVRLNDRSGVRGAWIVDSAPADARVALNAGQFMETGPWGWIVNDGQELAGPRNGPLAGAIAFDSSGQVRWYTDADVAYIRRRKNDLVTAFQSYPLLLLSGAMPRAVRTGAGLDAGHRDARLAIGQLSEHELLIVLTRFGVRESFASRIPIGLTTRETAALMRALGCSNALMLDGGLSAQLLVRSDSTRSGSVQMWRGARRVPVALVFRNR